MKAVLHHFCGLLFCGSWLLAPCSIVYALDETENKVLVVDQSFEELWLDVELNKQRNTFTVLVLKNTQNQLYVAEEDLKVWQLKIPELQKTEYLGQSYYALNDLDIQVNLNLQKMTLSLQTTSDHFETNILQSKNKVRPPLTPSATGLFFNYDVAVNYDDQRKKTQSHGFFEFATFSWRGSANTTFVAKNMTEQERSAIRLDSAWRIDLPNQMQTLLLGDTTSKGTSWSGSERFAGLQWGSNFSTQPYFNRLPLMDLQGDVVLPSTLDLYINNSLKMQQQVNPGPFSIQDIATVTGHGQAKLIMKDILGREQIITQDFYNNPQLLRKGLNEYNIELGVIRENYAVKNADYGDFLATATWRRGLSNQLTMEAHAQYREEQFMMGVGAYTTLPFATQLSLVFAGSQHQQKQGDFMRVALQKSTDHVSVGLDHQRTSLYFSKLGQHNPQASLRQQNKLYASFNLWDGINLNLNYAQQKSYVQDDAQFLSLNLSKNLSKQAYLQLSANHFLDTHQTTIGLGMSFSLDSKKTLSLNSSLTSEKMTHSVQLQKSLPVGTGFGYRVKSQLSEQDQLHHQLSVSYQNNHLYSQWELAQQQENVYLRGNLRGGLAMMQNKILSSRYIEDSFAVVNIGDFANVRVYAENQEVGKTNQQGYALIPKLRPYQRNQIGIEQADFPISVDLTEVEKEVYPYARTGVMVDFKVKQIQEAFFAVVDEMGQAIPMDALLTDQTGQKVPVGARGEIYITDLPQSMQFKVELADSSCEFKADPAEVSTQNLEFKTLTCSRIQ